MKKLFFCIMVSIIFVYFSMRGIYFEALILGFTNAKYIYLLPVVLIFLSLQWLRSLRWALILSPIENITQKRLFPVSCIGFMAVAIFPLRLGELARPYLISRQSNVSLSAALATIFVERLLDSLILVTVLLLVICTSPLPRWLVNSGIGLFVLLVALLVFLCLLYFKTENVMLYINKYFQWLPYKLMPLLKTILNKFVAGLQILTSGKELLYVTVLSACIWGLSCLAIYFLFLFNHFELPFSAAIVVLLINIIGISLPAAPGFVGNFQYGCIVGLALFGVPKGDAFVFSMAYYLSAIGLNVLLGVLFLSYANISLRSVMNGLMSFKKQLS